MIKDIPEGWETGATSGDVLTVKPWEGELTLMKGDKAVCDTDSEYAKDYCEEIE
ncbi:hypothetical protein CHCC19466_1307 [Bacillus licheniformis]|nr:hypothetical protein CHCC19466_1307 [Bacillus licheniformis]TWL94570.1 hypothetical protein CHCC15291_3333 [Bacillus licheniformis]TWM05600.1 hypothetical protein CHCC15289_1862 [Bacillus licheniformis]